MKTVPHYPTLVFDEIVHQNFIGATATQEDIERGLASKHEVTRNRWAAIQKIREESK
jgi:hypothetical protein